MQVMLFSIMQHARIIQGHFNVRELVVQYSKLYDFRRKKDAPLELSARWFFGDPTGDTTTKNMQEEEGKWPDQTGYDGYNTYLVSVSLCKAPQVTIFYVMSIVFHVSFACGLWMKLFALVLWYFSLHTGALLSIYSCWIQIKINIVQTGMWGPTVAEIQFLQST